MKLQFKKNKILVSIKFHIVEFTFGTKQYFQKNLTSSDSNSLQVVKCELKRFILLV